MVTLSSVVGLAKDSEDSFVSMLVSALHWPSY